MSSRPDQSAIEAACAIGLDVGGTKMAGGLVTPNGQVMTSQVIPTRPERGGEAVLADALQLASNLAGEARKMGVPLKAVGVGVGELVDLNGQVVSAHTIGWRGLPVQKRFAEIAPAVVEADSRAAAFGEARFGAGQAFRSFLYITVGTGIGSSFVMDGIPYAGARGCTGTLASSPFPSFCECGAISSPILEELASGPALVTRFKRQTNTSVTRGEEVLAAATAGCSEARQIIQTAAEALGGTVALLVNMLDPEAVIVGGGLGMAQGLYWDGLVAATRRYIWSDIHRDLPIIQAARGTDAGLVGAAAVALYKLP